MRDKIEIEVYKKQVISYNVETDKFECDIELNGEVKLTKRQSLKDVRREIDNFIKTNLNFKPFKLFSKREYSDELDLFEAIGIRTDGTLVVQDMRYKNNKSYMGLDDLKEMYLYDSEIKKEYEEQQKADEEYRKKSREKFKAIAKKLKRPDFSQYNLRK